MWRVKVNNIDKSLNTVLNLQWGSQLYQYYLFIIMYFMIQKLVYDTINDKQNKYLRNKYPKVFYDPITTINCKEKRKLLMTKKADLFLFSANVVLFRKPLVTKILTCQMNTKNLICLVSSLRATQAKNL